MASVRWRIKLTGVRRGDEVMADTIEIHGKEYNILDEFYRTMENLDGKTLIEMLDHYTTEDEKREWLIQWHEDDEE